MGENPILPIDSDRTREMPLVSVWMSDQKLIDNVPTSFNIINYPKIVCMQRCISFLSSELYTFV